eukprot:g7296.t2
MEGFNLANGMAQIGEMLVRNIARVQTLEEDEILRRVPRWRRFAAPLLTVIAFAAGAIAFFVTNKETHKDSFLPTITSNTKEDIDAYNSSDESSDDEEEEDY